MWSSKRFIQTHSDAFLLMTIAIIIIGLISIDLYVPSLPAIANKLAHSAGMAQLTMTIFLISMGISQLFYGPLSDIYGRRPLLILGLSIYTLGSFFCVMANNIEILLLGRLLQGLGAGSSYSLGGTLVNDTRKGSQLAQAFSYIIMALAVSPALAPAIGGFIQKWFNYQGNFIFMLLSGVAILSMTILFLPETHTEKKIFSVKTIQTDFKQVLSNIDFLILIGIATMIYASIIVYSTLLPFIFQNSLGYSAAHFGIVILVIASGLIIGSLTNVKLVTSHGMVKMILQGIIISVVSSLALLFLALAHYFNVYVIVIPLVLLAYGGSFILSNCYAGAISIFPNNAGIAAACYGTVQVLMTVGLSAAVMLVPTQNQLGLAWIITILTILSLILFIIKQARR